MAESMPSLTVKVRVKPGSSRVFVGGTYEDALVVAVQEPAVDGKATEAALRVLSDALGVPRRDVSLRSGGSSRTKLIIITNPPAGLSALIDAFKSGNK